MIQLKAVAVGAGYFSQYHYDAWSRIPEVQLTAVCDLDIDKAKRVRDQYGIARACTDFQQVLYEERPDFVDIITRPEIRQKLCQQAASQGAAIICQKPLAPTMKQARQIVDDAAAAGVPLMVHENFRFQPWHREMKRLINEGAIGDKLHSLMCRSRPGDGWQPDAYLARQPYFRDMPRFLIYETGVHFVDTFRYLAGEIDGVYAMLRQLNSEIKGEDAGIVCFEFQSGAHGMWDANRYNESNAQDPRYTFGEFLVEGNGGSIRLYPDGRMTIQPLGEAERDHQYIRDHRAFASDCVYATQRHFIDSLLSGEEFETSGAQYLRTLEIQEAIYESARQRTPIRGLADGQ